MTLASIGHLPCPGAALHWGAEGERPVRVRVGPDARPDGIELARSSGDRDLDRTAVLAARGGHVRPARVAGRAVAARVVVPEPFRLDRG